MDSIELFNKLAAIDCRPYIEKLKVGAKELSYLSWAHAWALFAQNVKSPNYKINEIEINDFGVMIHTEVTAYDITYKMWLPVLDSMNKPKRKESINSFDINTTTMRCLVKNLAMFGLGINIYAGEDLPLVREEVALTEEEQKMVDELISLRESENSLIVSNFNSTQIKWLDNVIKEKDMKLVIVALEKIKQIKPF